MAIFFFLEEIRSTFRCRSSSRDISCRCIRFERDTCSEDSPFAYRIIAAEGSFFFRKEASQPFLRTFRPCPPSFFSFFSGIVSSFCAATLLISINVFNVRGSFRGRLFVRCVSKCECKIVLREGKWGMIELVRFDTQDFFRF